jgi:uncharacterized protein
MCVGDLVKNYGYLIKPASSLCNYACSYCFYHDVADHREVRSSGIMSDEIMNALISNALSVEDGSVITYAFQGGEPTLAGLEYFIKFVSQVEKEKKYSQKVQYSIQTNGSLIDQAWCDFLFENKFLVGLSLDGYGKNHDLFRKSRTHQPTYDRVMESLTLLKVNHIDFNILTVLTSELSKHPKELYDFYKAHDLRFVQLIPCLPGLDGEENTHALKPSEFASFTKEFYSLWLEDYKRGHYVSVSLFDNIIPMFRGFPPQQCGMLGFCSPQYVVEADGNVYPCDFYVLDQYVSGNVCTHSFEQIRNSLITTNFLREDKRMSTLCTTCKFKKMCHGNCKRLNITYFDDKRCGYKEFLEFVHVSMMEIAKNI